MNQTITRVVRGHHLINFYHYYIRHRVILTNDFNNNPVQLPILVVDYVDDICKGCSAYTDPEEECYRSQDISDKDRRAIEVFGVEPRSWCSVDKLVKIFEATAKYHGLELGRKYHFLDIEALFYHIEK